MPSMSALTVMKFDGATAIIYGIKAPAAGDGSWAQWRQDSGNAAPYAARPTLSIKTTESKTGVRRVDILYVFPYFYTDSTTSQVVISPLNVSFRNGQMVVPQGIPPTFIQEAGAQFANLVAHAQVKQCLIDQSAFT